MGIAKKFNQFKDLAIVFTTVFLVSGPTFSEEKSAFKSCNEPALVVQRAGLLSREEQLRTCGDSKIVPTWDKMDDFVDNFNRYQSRTPLPGDTENFLAAVSKKVRLLGRMNLKELEIQKSCFKENKSEKCGEIRKNIKSGIKENWHDMSLGLVLGFQDNSAVRYQFGATEPDLFIWDKVKHPFGNKIKIPQAIKTEAQEEFSKRAKHFGPKIDSGLRDDVQKNFKSMYVNSLLKAPIMALVNSPTPSDKEITNALDEMIENNKELVAKKFDLSELSGFYPVIDSIVSANPQYCNIADSWIEKKKQRDKNKGYLKLGLAGATGVGCLATAWTGVGLSLCYASGVLLTGYGVSDTLQNKRLERLRTFTSALDSKLVSDFDKLSEAEQNLALELAMAPLAGLGGGTFLRSIASGSKVGNWLKRFNDGRKGLLSGARPVSSIEPQNLSQTARGLQDDVELVRNQYKQAGSNVDVKVCGINVGGYMCNSNVQSLLQYAVKKYPNFDLSKARVIKIQSPEYVPLYANNATNPTGFQTTSGAVKDFAKKTRTAEDGSTTWSKHYVLEYEGRVYDFDYAGDVAPTTARYLEDMFSDTLSGVVKNETRSTYLVRSIDAEEFMNTKDMSRFDLEGPGLTGQEYFFDFYKGLPGSNQGIRAPSINPERARTLGDQ